MFAHASIYCHCRGVLFSSDFLVIVCFLVRKVLAAVQSLYIFTLCLVRHCRAGNVGVGFCVFAHASIYCHCRGVLVASDFLVICMYF